MFYLCYLSLYFLLAFSSQTSEWMAREYVRNSWQYDAVFITCDGFVALSPSFWGDGQIAPDFAEKCDDAVIWSVAVTKWCNISKLENILSKDG